ncbi:sigma-70 family RNA polymerase sigma factor [Streptomyces sp. TLI_146]|uniref:sigma-70 family RNA polymerase sigma factor n=1 Tax=Streptomyces sp. TLI_146 TaxID=1938858 RepID=UPI000C709386|nr:sigma-70 family RNA polymerase sigma factor [Streptomyces sp. TLI_146]PKV88396.1 RNA polymerase sigma-70 factor (ECF subfamily) [Streptomyces sp. TLI_146]
MDDGEWLARRFEENRPHLRAVAYRMLGTLNEADEAVEEAWLQIIDSGDDATDEGVRGLPAWLMTVVANVSLDRLRSRRTVSPDAPLLPLVPAARRAPDDLAAPVPDALAAELAGMGPAHEELLADSVGLALLVVLETLDPAERMAFVLHDLFGLPYEEIAPIVGAADAQAARELAGRARVRVQSVDPLPDAPDRRRRIVDSFLSASRGGDFDTLVAMLAPDVVLHADPEAVAAGAPTEVRGADSVAKTFSGRARYAQLALVDGSVGAVWAPRGRPRVVFGFTIVDERITGIDMRAAPDRLSRTDLTILGD